MFLLWGIMYYIKNKNMKKIIDWIKNIIKERKRKKHFKKKLEELKKRDPFIYNH